MSVTVRLVRIGKKFAPSFKVVAANTRGKRNGKYLDVLGHYNPSTKPADLNIDADKLAEWKAKGAIVSKSVAELETGTYKFKPYRGKKGAASDAAKESEK
ncbi:MAG: 30S ribosomal protein S16 [Patescibacteria group bacterium]|uniref:Small ribosomal subunit protein bS16 n=1 Tax=candidate division WWE3 bacterium TaxID=2053526 RepID=A0A955J1Y1_UNCKA|nr:30S ribosomal protein S16 [candidate division WWE3 bacterium]